MAFFGRVISAADAQSVWSYCAEHLRLSQSTRFGVTHISASTFGFTQLHEIVSRLGLIPTQGMRDGGVTFLTSFFLHAGVLHLVGNIYSFLSWVMTSRIFSARFVILRSSLSPPSSAISHTLRLIRPPKCHVSAPAAVLPV